MSRSLMQSTQVGVSLTLTVVTKTDSGQRLDMARLVNLTPLLFWLWTMAHRLNRLTIRAARLAARALFGLEVGYRLAIDWLAEPVKLPGHPLLKTLAKNLWQIAAWIDEGLLGFWQTFLTGGGR